MLTALNIALYKPQIRHLIRMVVALLTSNEKKTISGLYRLLKGQPDPKSGADFLRESPWEPKDISRPRKRWMVKTFLELVRKMNVEFEIFIGIDDSLGKKGKRPKYSVCTDLTLSIQQVLRYYQKRWPVEVDNTYLKNALGLGGFRQQSFEATQKWFAVVMLALNYLQYRLALAYNKNLPKASLADFIRQHRLMHFQTLLRTVLKPLTQPQQIEM